MRERFGVAFQASRFDSLRKLSDASACAESQAGKVASGVFDKSKDGPGVFSIWRMADSMGVTLNDLLPPSKPIIERPGIKEFFARYDPNDPHLSNFSNILEYCDIYAEPRAGRSRIVATGSKSLLVEKTQITDPALHQVEYDSWPQERRKTIFEWQRRAWRIGAIAEPEDFAGAYKTSSRNVRIPILRAACRVLSDDLKPRLLIYCEQLW